MSKTIHNHDLWSDEADPEAESRKKQTDEAVSALSERWRRQYERHAQRQTAELLKDAVGALADERVVLEAAARDLVLAERLWRAQVQLAGRVSVMIDNPRMVLMLAKALREVSGCRSASTTRAQELLIAAGTLRAQRKLSNIPHLRRVA